MSVKGIKALVARLHSDDETRSRFASDPEAVISQYNLTATEKDAIKASQMRLGPDGTIVLQQGAQPLSWWMA